MPTYTYQCSQCRDIFDRLLPLANYRDLQASPCCNMPSTKLLMPTAIRGDYQAYECPVTGRLIEGRRAHEENLKRQGCRVLEPGETENAKRASQKAEADLDKSVDETVERFYDALPSDKREALATEVINGATATVARL